ncbi:hypothetical protein [Stappia stellulata]|uniref:hypothetical protein n=1 Tax=Stappia stellulata TaxID=71235 RepID=UPI000411604D|nr:hypothetical protein [Stappia stellulata]
MREDGIDPQTGLVWRYRPAPEVAGTGEKILVVVFSQARVADGRFGLERLFAQTRHACLFLKGPDADWYRNCDDAIDRVIARACDGSRPARIVYYGASKGAYGALVTGLRRGDGEIHAFGPEFRLGRPGTQSGLVMDADPDARDPLSMLEDNRDGPLVHLLFGIFDAVDAEGAARCLHDSLPTRARTLILRSSHASHDHLYSLNIIRKLITRFDRDLGALCAERGLIGENAPEDIARFARAGAEFAVGRPEAALALDGDPYMTRNPGLALLAAEALIQTRHFDRAETQLAATQARIDRDPVLRGLPKRWRKHVWRLRMSARRAAGDRRGFTTLRQEARSRFPEDATFARDDASDTDAPD